MRREAVVRPLAERGGRLGRAAVAAAAAQLGLSTWHTNRLVNLFRAKPVTSSLVLAKPGPRKGARRLQPAVEAAIERSVEGFYEAPEKPTLKALHRRVRADCRAAGLPVPSPKALSARVGARDLRKMVAAREGPDAARGRFAPAVGRLHTTAPLQVVQIDHTLVDVQLVDERHRAPIGRPWLTLALDVHTRAVLGLHASLDTPSATGVALAITHAVLPKDDWLLARGIGLAWPLHGKPAVLHLDNAAEFHSRALRRGCQQHGMRLEFRPPGRPHYGGHIERLMGTLMRRLHALPGTTFSNVAQRGDYPSEARAVLTLGEFERILALEVLGPYHNDVHSALGMTPAAAWAGWIEAGGVPGLPADRGGFVLDFLPAEERVVGRQGIQLFNVHYYDGVLAGLVGAGLKLRVKYDPRDLSVVFAEMPSGDHVRVPYADLRHPPVALWEHREAVKRLRAEGRRTVDEHAIFAAVEEQRRVLAEAGRSSKAARRGAERVAHARRDGPVGPRPPPSAPAPAAPDPEARVPVLTAEDIGKTEFWS